MKLSKILKNSVSIFFLLNLSLTVFARTYYVSSTYTGSTSNGNFSTPWKNLATVQNNFSTIQPGDTIAFKKGDVFPGTLSISKSGLQNLPIVIESYGSGNKPQFVGTGSTISSLFYLYNKSFIVFNDLDITDNSISPTDRSIPSKIQLGFYFDGTSTNNIIKNCKISLVGVGLYLSNNCNRNTLDSCDIGNMRMVVNTPTSVNPDDDYGANPIVISSSYNTIKHSFFHDCWALSYDYGYDGGAVEFYGGTGVDSNLVAYNTFFDCNGTVEMGSSSGGYMNNNTFVYNKFINNGKLFYINNSGQYAVNIQNLFFGNNIIIESNLNRLNETNLGSMSVASSLSNIINFKNNVFQLSTGIDVLKPNLFTATQFNHQNNIYKLSNGSFTNFTLSASDLLNNTNFWTNTLDPNPLNWDYHPSTNSVLIDYGQTINQQKDFEGKNIVGLPEAGILERISNITIVPLNINIGFTPIFCNGDSTNISISATGGIPPYTGVGNFKKIAGSYSFVITDGVGNTATASISVPQPTIINLSVSVGTITNYGGTASANITANGGAGSYLYSLDNSNFQTSNQFNNINSGNHKVNVKDQNGCIVTKDIYIAPFIIEPLSITISTSTINCNGENSTIIVAASGGISPYVGTGTFRYLAGNYTFSVTDSIGNTISKTINISQPSPIIITSPSSNISTNTIYNSIQIVVSGGSPQYLYKLDNGNLQSNAIFDSIIPGTHTITVTDANKCQQTFQFNINKIESAPLQIIIDSKTNVTCKGGNDGNIRVSGLGGTSPYFFALDTISFTTNNQFTNLRAGIYNIYIKDNNNRIASVNTTILDGVKKCRGIKNTAGNNHHKLEIITYPNPSNNYFNLNVNSESDEEIIISIMDVNGRLISKEKKNIEKINQIGQELKSGIYFMRIQQGNEITTQKLIKL